MTIFKFKPYSLQTIAKPIPVLPAVPSTIVPPFDINFLLRASCTINKAARSLTDSPGLKYYLQLILKHLAMLIIMQNLIT